MPKGFVDTRNVVLTIEPVDEIPEHDRWPLPSVVHRTAWNVKKDTNNNALPTPLSYGPQK